MRIYVISHATIPSVTPFRILADSEDEALARVRSHMGSDNYKVIRTEQA